MNGVFKWDVQGVPTFSELGFAAAALPQNVKVAAVTGTNGKSTVTTFTGQVDKLESLLVMVNQQPKCFLHGSFGMNYSQVFLLLCMAATSVVEKSRSADIRGRQSWHSALRGRFAVPCISRRGSSF